MIYRRLLMATAILTSGVITACSDMIGPTEMQSPGLAGGASFAEGSRPCVAPGGGFSGAFNMLHDATMFTIPGVRAAEQGVVGMFHAIDVSSC
jgi:hypothetical protein